MEVHSEEVPFTLELFRKVVTRLANIELSLSSGQFHAMSDGQAPSRLN